MSIVTGPVWTQAGSGRYAGRYPLAAERHTLAQVDRLLPGVTTVTPHGRYYALHGLVAAEAERRGLADEEAQRLLRRVEVALTAVSLAHEKDPKHYGLSRAHGIDVIASRATGGVVNVNAAAARVSDGAGPERYAQADWGYLGPYRGSEIMVGILQPDTFRPGPGYDDAAVRPALHGLFDLAEQPTLTVADLAGSSSLCICGGMTATDGEWLARLLAPSTVASSKSRASTRRDTIRMITRTLDLAPIQSFTRDVSAVIAYGPHAETDEVLGSLDVTAGWRGTVLRAESVAAWRALWAWLVNQITGITSRTGLADQFADQVRDVRVGAFVDALPALRDEAGDLAPAERDPTLTALADPERLLAILMLGGQRASDLTGPVLVGFHGKGVEATQQLGPLWVADTVEEWRDRSLPDFVRHLTQVMVDRAQRVAFSKARFDKKTGLLRVPTRVYLRDDLVYRDSNEGSGPVGLRWEQLGTVLAEAGVITHETGAWTVTDRGRDVLT